MLPEPIQPRASFRSPMAMLLVFLAGLLTVATPSAQAQDSDLQSAAPVRLTHPIDERNLVPLEGNTRRDLTPDRDLGPVEDSMPLHLYMVLQRTPEQQADLDYLIARQQERTAPEYHQWLTPRQFGARFGAHPDDIATLSNWLESHGMEVRSVLNNASIIDFAATAGQIREAFHTELHYFDIAGGKYAANVADPQIPAALAPVVAAIHGMVRIPMHANHTPLAQKAYDKGTQSWRDVSPANASQVSTGQPKPDFDPGNLSTARLVSPQDLYKIYDINPIFTGGNLAQTAKIAVVEQSDMVYGTVNTTTGAATGGDLATFRSAFGVEGTLNMHVYHGYGTVKCSDPGIVASDEGNATVNAEWANATAPSANLIFMACDNTTDQGAISSLLAVVDNNLADVISLSYTVSELGATASLYTFMDTVEALAATQGQSIVVAAGNGGSDEQDFGTTTVATNGINVSAYSSPLVTVAGATDFQDFFDASLAPGVYSTSKYWNTNNSQYYEDVLGYVPESAWNDSCASSLNSLYEPLESEGRIYPAAIEWCALHGTGDNGTVRAGGGGLSTHYPVPAWQAGIAGYSGTYRGSPDIASFGSDGRIYSRELLACDSTVTPGACSSASAFDAGGGTSFVAPYIAGVAALLVTHTGSRQGLLNPTLYALAKAQYTNLPTSCYANGQTQNDEETVGLPAASCTFNDVTTGGNDVPCAAGSTDCIVFRTEEPWGLLTVDDAYPVIPNAYASAPGYDQATGIGSLNVNNLIANWDTAFTSATTLTASATLLTPSQSATLKATVKGSGAAGYVDNPPVPTGTASFKAGTKALGTCALSAGTCSLTVPGTALALGANSITATFAGSPLYPSSTSSVLTVTVDSSLPAATTLTSPTQGSTLAGPTETFTWAAASGATGYLLQLGSTGVGSDNLLNSTEYSSTTRSATVASLPVNGETIYARLITDYNGTHLTKDYVFTAAKQALLTSPTQGTTLPGPSVTFDWATATGSVKGYFLQLGSTGVGSNNLLNSTEYSAATKSATIGGLPVNGETIYARIVTDYNGTHATRDYIFTAAKQSALTAPAPGTTLTGATATFDWSKATGSNLKGYLLQLGTTGVGSSNLLNSSEYPTTQTSATVANLPTTGGTIYARITTDYNGTHISQDFTYKAK